METSEIAELIVERARSLFDRGFSVGSAGNISARVSGGFLMTPTNSSLGRLDPAQLSVLDENWNHIAGPKPSKEVPMHRAFYDGRPETGALVHLHSTHVVAMSLLHRPGTQFLPPLTAYQIMRAGVDIPVIRYFKPGSDDVVAEIKQLAPKHKVMVLAHHGSLVGGKDLTDAANTAEELEVSAQLALLTRGQDPNLLTQAQIDELLS